MPVLPGASFQIDMVIVDNVLEHWNYIFKIKLFLIVKADPD